MDSKKRRSIAQDVEPMRKSSKVTGTPHDSEWVLTIEWGGTDKIETVLKLLPACSATLVCRVRVVDPTYPDVHRAQQRCARPPHDHPFRTYWTTSRKFETCKLDIDFLVKCKTYNIFPKFLHFKLYKRSLHTTNFYKAWQNKLLFTEIKCKKAMLMQQHHAACSSMNLHAETVCRSMQLRAACGSSMHQPHGEAWGSIMQKHAAAAWSSTKHVMPYT